MNIILMHRGFAPGAVLILVFVDFLMNEFEDSDSYNAMRRLNPCFRGLSHEYYGRCCIFPYRFLSLNPCFRGLSHEYQIDETTFP